MSVNKIIESDLKNTFNISQRFGNDLESNILDANELKPEMLNGVSLLVKNCLKIKTKKAYVLYYNWERKMSSL